MNSILSKNVFFVKEHVGMFKASSNFDIYDPTNPADRVGMQGRKSRLPYKTIPLYRLQENDTV